MRVFVTGATGFIGSAVVRDLLDAGHQVVGLARSDEGAAKLAATGAEVRRGTLQELDALRAEAAAADGVIHTAFIHDFANFAASAEVDRLAIEAFGEALAGSDRPLVVAGGTALLGSGGGLATEESAIPASSPVPRVSEQTALRYADAGVRASVVRLPPSVHGEGDTHGFVPTLIKLARTQGTAAYLDEGTNVWPAVHRFDAARVFRLAVESAPAGRRLHAVADQGIPLRRIAEIIGATLNVPVKSVSSDDAEAYFGWFSHFAAVDHSCSSALTQEWLGWRPEHIGLVEDLEAGHYFAQK